MAENEQFFSKVVGVSHSNADGASRQLLIGKFCKKGQLLNLVREPDNPEDKFAIGVWINAPDYPPPGVQIGYLIADVARQATEVLQAGGNVIARISEITGGTKGKPTLGVNIEIRFADSTKPANSPAPTTALSAKPKNGAKWKITTGGLVLALVAFCCGAFGVGALFSLGEDATEAPEAPITQVAITQIISPQTQTPYPTYTPQATLPPETIFVTPTMPKEWTLIQSLTGQGKYTTELFTLATGLVKITWEYVGSGNFAFSLKRFDNNAEDLLENTIGNSTGQKILNVGASDQYVIDVLHGDGSWQITVEFMPQ